MQKEISPGLVVGVISKPFDVEELLQKIAALGSNNLLRRCNLLHLLTLSTIDSFEVHP